MSVRLYRVHRVTNGHPPPVPGNAKGAAHVGDYIDVDYAGEAAAAAFAPGVSCFIEPVNWNGDTERPEYANDGDIMPWVNT